MTLFLLMNATDFHLQNVPGGFSHFIKAGSFPISQFIAPAFNGMSNELVMLLNEGFWWLHIVGIMIFLNYIPYSKHFHVFLAFPNVYYSKLKPDTEDKKDINQAMKKLSKSNASPQQSDTL